MRFVALTILVAMLGTAAAALYGAGFERAEVREPPRCGRNAAQGGAGD